MSKEVCKIFIKFDNVFKNKEPDLKKINNINGPYIRSCPYDKVSSAYKCNSNLEGIYVLCIHLFKELFNLPQDKRKRENNNNQYVEYIMMWLSYRLFQTKSYNSPTLIDFYNKHLMKSYLNYGYDDLIKKKENLKDANLYYMSRFYQLFNEICHVILKHSNNNINAKEIKKDSVRLYNNYKSLYDYINECDSYLNLLNNLKTQHENFKNSLISNKRNRLYVSVISVNLKNLPHTRQPNKISPLGFNCPKCKKVHSKVEEINPKSTPILPKSKSAGSSSRPQQSQKQAQQQKPEASPAKPAAPSEKLSAPTTTQLPSPALIATIQKGSFDSQGSSKQGNTLKSSDSDKHNTASDTGKQGGDTLDKQEQPQDGKQQISSHKQETSDSLGNSDPKYPTNELEKQSLQSNSAQHKSETKEPLPPEISQQTQPHSVQLEPQSISESTKFQKEGSSYPNEKSNSKIEPKGLGSENGNASDGSSEPEAPNGGKDDPPSGSHVPSQDGKPDITNPLDQIGTSSTSGGSFSFGSSFLDFLLNGTKIYNKVSQFIKDNHQKFKDAKDQINDAYNNTVNNLKNAYSVSSIYFSSIIHNITNQLNQVDIPSKSGISGKNISQNSDKSQKSEVPPQLPPKDSESNPTLGSPEQKQPPSQSKHIMQQPPQLDSHNHKTSVHLVKSPSSEPTLRTPWNIIPTTWNGSEDCKPEINFMNTTLVCCTSEQCSITGISVILVLIPIILLIVYKYLSSGWRKEMKRKKNMKKVINSIGGKKPMQIIINASSQKKKIKKPINSFNEKISLLNIYKLMQADPVPFINLFFLLIFFVYKRKHNSLEVLHFTNERNIYLEKNIINFRNNRILADADNQFDLYDFYQSTSSLISQFNDCNDGDDKIANLRSAIDSHIKKHKENNTSPNLNNADKKTKNLIYELQKELDEAKKEFDNIRSNELAIQPIQDKRVIKTDGNISVSEHEDFKQFENYENILEIGNYNFEDEYNEIISNDIYEQIKIRKKIKKEALKAAINWVIGGIGFFLVMTSGSWPLTLLMMPNMFSVFTSYWKIFKIRNKLKFPK
ncbi:hypothetical protein YYG_03282 [Plasmodium vinckei petteri]|uniref:PIR protein CIR protein n=1 Tax=Plasmodium vinckei petteri TaxID=138298 RepID=W7AD66_PLAVN|nr:hypothetical protein YYG_03282 [Plasmodium vinckei petteri]